MEGKKTKKENRAYQALLGLVELYLKLGKPIGSSTLRENGFDSLSSATLRNYFATLEEEGFLLQPHASGGRVPTSKAFRLYAEDVIGHPSREPELEEKLQALKKNETRNIALYLQKSAELLSETTGYATFLSSVRFDHDFIFDIKFVGLDSERLLCILITHFGQVFTETIMVEKKVSSFALKRLESYFQWKLKNKQEEFKPSNLTKEEEEFARHLYNEVMVRYLVRYSNFSDEDMHRTGFSRLLAYPEFSDPLSLTSGLSLFENTAAMRRLLETSERNGKMTFWVGSDLSEFCLGTSQACSILAIPFKINHIVAGAVGILGPTRMPYKRLFRALELFSDYLSESLTKTLYKFKLSFRTPNVGSFYLKEKEWSLLEQKPHRLLELKEKS